MGFFPVSPQSIPPTGGTFTGPVTVAGLLTTQAGISNSGAAIQSTAQISTSGLNVITSSAGFNAGIGSVDLPSAGAGLKVAEGSNAKQGTFTLTGGGTTQAIPNTSVTANSRIFLGEQVAGGTPGLIGVASRIAGTSFTVSCVTTDTSTYAYEIFEPG